MKKVFIGFLIVFLSACSLAVTSTPKQIVSEFLDKYKNQDNVVMNQLEDTINSEYSNEDYRNRYKTLMINQYKNMEYEIKDEIIEDDNAVVEAQITVYDYASAIRNSNDYLNNNPKEFMLNKPTIDMNDAKDETTKDPDNNVDTSTSDKTNNQLDTTSNSYDVDKFTDYKLSQMENVSDTVSYTIQFSLTKVDGKWVLDSLSNTDIEKLHGIYNQG